MFFLPGGLGGDYEFLVYARLTHFVSENFAFYGLRARSADGTEYPHHDVEEMAADYLREIRMVQPEGPYFIVGNCIGGIVAYEIAQQLRRQGQDVALLALMDTLCPTSRGYRRHLQRQLQDRFRNRFHRALATWRDNYYLARIPFHWHQFREIGWQGRLPYVLRKTGIAVAECIQSTSDLSVKETKSSTEIKREKIQRGYMDTLLRYRPRDYLGKAVMLVNERAYDKDPALGWSELILGGIDIRRIPGDHEAYIRAYVKTAAETLRECLKAASVSAPKQQIEVVGKTAFSSGAGGGT